MAEAKRRRGGSRTREEYPDYSVADPHDLPDSPDVLLDVPVLKVDEIDVEVDDLRAQVAVLAELRDMVEIGVGADVSLGQVELKIEGVEAQALLKARLGNVTRILERVLTSLDRNPELLESVGRAAREAGRGAGRLVGEAGEAVEQVGEGAGQATEEVGRDAGRAVGEVGEGARQAVGSAGAGAGRALGGVVPGRGGSRGSGG